jgi:putative ABC transport system ATP-binding protein
MTTAVKDAPSSRRLRQPDRIAEQPALAVSCRDLIKEFGQLETRVQVLRGIDLEVYAGELTLLVGPSGCGKTTLLSVLAGLLEPTAGEVTVLGTRLSGLSGRQVVKFRQENIGFVFQ